MATPRFIHTHLHDEFSTLDAIGTADQYCKKAVELGQKAISITNHGNIDSFVRFQKASDKHNIKVLFGCELYLVENVQEHPKKEKRGHACVWIKNEKGFNNLLKILTFANVYGFYRRPRCSFEYFGEHLDGLVVGTACTSSFINLEGGIELFEQIVAKQPNDIFLEIMPHGMEDQLTHNAKCLELSRKYNVPLLLSHDVHYVEKNMARSQEVLLCMQSGDKMSNPNRWKFDIDDLYLCESEYIFNKIKEQGVIPEKDCIQAMKNTLVLADKCNFKIKKQEMSLPIPPQFEGMDENELFRDLCLDGLKKRFNDGIIPNNYIERFEKEYKVIRDKGFIRYFLIVHDTIVWCKSNNIMHGPRGSAAGCLISYALQIVDIDPVANLLIFERFLNEQRTAWPDIDLDLQKEKRHLVVERLKTIYGQEKVCNVSTFLKMEARTIIRDVARVYEIPLFEVDKFSKSIVTSIDDAIEETQEGKEFYEKNKEWVDIARSLQGQVKSRGKHAGGIVISPINVEEGKAHLIEQSGSIVANWDKNDVEWMGLIKFDFLGLATLDVISETLRLVKQNHNKDIDLYKIDINDKRVYDELNKGNTVGFFQANTFTLTRLIKDMKVENINQLSDALAGCRPGPLETTTPEYVSNKKSGSFVSVNPVFDEITAPTYGVCIYQEQIMFILNRLAGFSMAECDEIRRVIGKKRSVEEFAPFREAFLKGTKEVGLFTDTQAVVWWENLLHYSRYGFNRCLSGKETLSLRYSSKKKRLLTIEELYKVTHDLSFAENNDMIPLRGKLLRNGYGVTLSMYDDGRIRENKIIDIRYSGKMPLYLVTTENGRSIKCTMNHSFPTPSGKKMLSEMTTGDDLFVKGEYEICINKYNFYKDGESPTNTPSIGERGFQENQDGDSVIYNKIKNQKHEQQESCEICSKEYDKNKRFELHHVDFDRTNNEEYNLQFLCVTCHKKIHYSHGRVKRFEKGVPVAIEKIESILFLGDDDCYDIEMEKPNHNFLVGSGIVTSNSHSLSYSYICFFTGWLKINYPSEYLAANLTYGNEAKEKLLPEAKRLNLKVISPLITTSHVNDWVAKEGKLFIPFKETSKIGPKSLETIQQYQDSLKPGFFTKEKPIIKGKLKSILDDIGAFNEESDPPTQNIDNYFLDLGICLNPQEKYKNLFTLIGKRDHINLDNWLTGNLIGENYGREITEPLLGTDLMQCCDCELRAGCKSHPLAPRAGKYNLAIIGESPNQDEVRSNRPFDSRDGKILWNSLQKYGFEESDFTKTHVVKCPTKKPPMSIIKKCSEKHLKKGLESCRIVLAIGNTAAGFFKGDNKGIIRLNGTTEWNEENSCWVCWAIPPGWSTWKPEDFEKPFKHAIKNYVSAIERIGGFV